MKDKIEEAKFFIQQKKHKKALSIIKKISHKNSTFTYEILELEASCLFQQKNYQLAKIKLEQALVAASTAKQKLSVLSNITAVCMQLRVPKQALVYLTNAMEIDDSTSTYGLRHTLVSIAFSVDDFDILQEYATPLINTLQYSISTRILLAHAAIKTDEHDKALTILSRLSLEIKTPELINFTPQDIVKVLDGFHLIKAFNDELSLLGYLKKDFGHTSWFKTKLQQLQAVSKPVEPYPEKTNVELQEKLIKVQSVNLPSEIVTGNTPQTVLSIKKLKGALEQMGAHFHPDLRIVEVDNDISVYCTSAQQQSQIFMEVPIKAMPLLNDYHFSLDEYDNLVVLAKSNMVNRHAKNIMFLLADMYNSAGKLASWKNTFPLFLLADFPVVTNKLFEGRANSSLLNMRMKGMSNETIIDTFVGSRIFGFSQDDLRKAGMKSKKTRMQGFIPIIELANHQMGGEGFIKNDRDSTLVLKSGSGQAGREIFVQYNLDDPLVTFVKYGFFDQSASWIYSIPIKIQTSKGLTFEIKNSMECVDVSTLPKNMQDLAVYFPAHCGRKGQVIYLSKLIIPQIEHVQTLNTVLTYILKQVDLEDVYGASLSDEILYLEKQIIRLNKAYWHELQGLIEEQQALHSQFPQTVSDSLLMLCEFSLRKINNYIKEKSIDLL